MMVLDFASPKAKPIYKKLITLQRVPQGASLNDKLHLKSQSKCIINLETKQLNKKKNYLRVRLQGVDSSCSSHLATSASSTDRLSALLSQRPLAGFPRVKNKSRPWNKKQRERETQ